MAALSVAGAQWRLTPAERMQLNTQLLPWALRAGNLSTDLMCLYYEEHFKVVMPCREGMLQADLLGSASWLVRCLQCLP